MSQLLSDVLPAVISALVIGTGTFLYKMTVLLISMQKTQDTHSDSIKLIFETHASVIQEVLQTQTEHDRRLDSHDIEIAVLKERNDKK